MRFSFEDPGFGVEGFVVGLGLQSSGQPRVADSIRRDFLIST